MPSSTHRPMTIGALLEQNKGVSLFCACGHRTALLPAQLSTMAHQRTRLLDFKRRFRCSMCGSNNSIRMTIFVVAAPFVDDPQQPRVRH